MRLSTCILVLALLPGSSLAAAGPQEGAERLTLDLIFQEEGPSPRPEGIAWSHDGAVLGYLLADGDGQALWALDPETGESRALVRAAGLPGAGEGEAEIQEFHFSPAGGAVLLEAADDLFLLKTASGEVTRLTATEEKEEDPKFSPDGTRIAFVRGEDLWLLEIAAGRERRLTHDGQPDVRLNGTTDWVYWEEIYGREGTGFWWSPDGKSIAYYQFDETEVRSYPLINPLPTYPEVNWQRYPKAGEANPRVRVGVMELASGRTTWLDTGEGDFYLARVDWLPAGGVVAVQRLNRDQTRLDVLVCGAEGGACSVLHTEEMPTWINLGDDYAFLGDGRFIWGTDRNGHRHLFLFDGSGELIRPLTQGVWSVTSLDAVDEAGGMVFFTAIPAPGMGAAHRRAYRVGLDGGAPFPLSGETGWAAMTVAPGGRHWVLTESTADRPPRHRVIQADGTRVAELPEGAPLGFDPAALPSWEFLSIWSLEGNRLPAQMLKPEGFDPQKRYPVIMYHYGGPGSQVVADRWGNRGRGLWHKMMAQHGYIVLKVDNAASLFFGKAGEDRLHRRFGPLELSGQLAGVEYLKTLPYVDPERIGLWGWSGGGANTLYAVLNQPGVWKAAVAGAPVTDWRLYDTIWTERYLDRPSDNPEGYRASSALTYAANLRDALLVVHGTADDNVHPQNSLVLANAFVEAGLPFEQAFYPGQKHGFRGAPLRHFFARMTDFFQRHLGGGEGQGSGGG